MTRQGIVSGSVQGRARAIAAERGFSDAGRKPGARASLAASALVCAGCLCGVALLLTTLVS